MKFVIDHQLLLSSLIDVSKGLSTKTAMPILSGISITALENKLIFTTTNKEISVQVELEQSEQLKIVTPGNCVILGKIFIEMVKKIEGNLVEITLFENTTLKIISGRTDFSLITLDKFAFPKCNFETKSDYIELKEKDLKEIIRQTTYAAATNDARLILTGVNFKIENNSLVVSATNAFRLATKDVILSNKTSLQKELTIPSKILEEFGKILGEESETVKIHFGVNKIIFVYKNIVFAGRLLEGTYPNISNLIPTESLLEVTFNKNELISAIDRATVFANLDTYNIIKLSLKQHDAVEITCSSNEIGKIVEEIIPLDIVNSQKFEISFSATYFIEALKAMSSNRIKIKFTGEIKAILIEELDGSQIKNIIIPVRNI